MQRQAAAVTAPQRELASGMGTVLGGALLLSAAMAVVYRSVLPWWIHDLWIDPNYSHGLLVPLAAGWLAYRQRDAIVALPPHPSRSAITLILGGLLLLALGLLAAELFVTRLSLLVVLTGLIAFILGYHYVRALALPLAFLLFMVPLPALVFNAIALPLQLLASQCAIATLQATGVPALREGNIILLPNGTLEVVEACSGLRSLISLGATSVMVAVVTLRRPWLRVILIALSIPIAILANAVRVSGTGMLAYRYGPSIAEGFFHVFSGWLVFLAAIALMTLAAAALRRLEEP